jgi:hypothetical protein
VSTDRAPSRCARRARFYGPPQPQNLQLTNSMARGSPRRSILEAESWGQGQLSSLPYFACCRPRRHQPVAPQPAVVLGEGDVRIAREVRHGEPFLSVPIRHTRTGVLQNDLYTDGPEIRRALFAPRGSKAMWLGYFVPRRSRDAEEGRDLWCFVPPGDEPSLNRCALGRDAIFVNPLYVTEIEYASPAGIHRTLSVLPIIAEAPVEIPPDLRLVYLMDEWRDDVLRYRLRSGLIEGAPLEPDGSALIQTIIGPVRLRRTDDPDAAIVEVATSITHISVDLDREIVEHRTRVIQSRPYPVVSATTPAPADADFRSIVSGDVILEQEVRPAMGLPRRPSAARRRRPTNL